MNFSIAVNLLSTKQKASHLNSGFAFRAKFRKQDSPILFPFGVEAEQYLYELDDNGRLRMSNKAVEIAKALAKRLFNINVARLSDFYSVKGISLEPTNCTIEIQNEPTNDFQASQRDYLLLISETISEILKHGCLPSWSSAPPFDGEHGRTDTKSAFHTALINKWSLEKISPVSNHFNLGLRNYDKANLNLLFRTLNILRLFEPSNSALSNNSPFYRNKYNDLPELGIQGLESARGFLFPPFPEKQSDTPLVKNHQEYANWCKTLFLDVMVPQHLPGVVDPYNVRPHWVFGRPNGDKRPYDINRVELRGGDSAPPHLVGPLMLLRVAQKEWIERFLDGTSYDEVLFAHQSQILEESSRNYRTACINGLDGVAANVFVDLFGNQMFSTLEGLTHRSMLTSVMSHIDMEDVISDLQLEDSLQPVMDILDGAKPNSAKMKREMFDQLVASGNSPEDAIQYTELEFVKYCIRELETSCRQHNIEGTNERFILIWDNLKEIEQRFDVPMQNTDSVAFV